MISSRSAGYDIGAKLLLLTLVLFWVFTVRCRANAEAESTPGVGTTGTMEVQTFRSDLPTPNSMPRDVFSMGGFIWYSAENANLLGRFSPTTQKFEEFHLRPGSTPGSLVPHAGSGVQGTVYFISTSGGFIGEFDPNTREVREFRIHGPRMLLHDIAFDRNGLVWFTVLNAKPPRYPQGSKIGRLNLFSSEMRFADTPTPAASPYDLTVNSKGIPFFTELDNPVLGSINPITMKITEYPLPHAKSRTRGLTITRDDVVWYTDYARGYLGRFDPRAGEFKEWRSPGGFRSGPSAITHVGNVIWYFESGTKPSRLIRFAPEKGKFESWPIQTGGQIEHVYARSDGSLWFADPLDNCVSHVTIRDRKE